MGADFDHVVRTIRQRLGAHPVPLQFPLGREDNFIGIINFLEQNVVVWLEETLGAKFEIFEVEKLWDKSFVDSRPDVAAALKGSRSIRSFTTSIARKLSNTLPNTTTKFWTSI